MERFTPIDPAARRALDAEAGRPPAFHGADRE
jgi:hypothetical protein